MPPRGGMEHYGERVVCASVGTGGVYPGRVHPVPTSPRLCLGSVGTVYGPRPRLRLGLCPYTMSDTVSQVPGSK